MNKTNKAYIDLFTIVSNRFLRRTSSNHACLLATFTNCHRAAFLFSPVPLGTCSVGKPSGKYGQFYYR